jgi:predicted Fe-Mo cluster-binding NifX family protein
LVGDVANRGGKVIAADADLTNVEADYIRSHAPKAPTFTVVNHHKGAGREIEFMTGKRAELEDRIVQAAAAQVEAYQAGDTVKPFIVASDSQKELEALDRRLVETYPELAQRIIRIDKKTTEEDWAKEFVANIDESIEAIKPWILMWSPSMSVGVSIEKPYFSRIFGAYFGVLEPCEFRQQLARYRPDCPVSLWAKAESNMSSGSRSFDPDEILRHMKASSKSGAEDAIDMATEIARGEADGDMDKFMEVLNNLYKRGSWDNSHMQLFANIKARENYARPQCGLQLRQELIDEENATIIDSVGDDAAISEEIKGEKKEIDFEYAEKLHEGAASDMTTDEAKEIKRNPGTKWAERAQADGVLLRESLPGVNLSPDWIFEHKVRSRQWLGQLRLYWAAKNLARTHASDAMKLKKRARQMLDGADCYLPDFRLKGAAVKAIAESGILEFETLDEYCAKSPEVKAITKWAKANRKFIYHEFGLSADPNNPTRFVGNFLKKLGLKQTKVRRDGNGQRWYAVAGAMEVDRRAVLLAWDEKYLAMFGETDPNEVNEVAFGACSLSLGYYRERFEEAAGACALNLSYYRRRFEQTTNARESQDETQAHATNEAQLSPWYWAEYIVRSTISGSETGWRWIRARFNSLGGWHWLDKNNVVLDKRRILQCYDPIDRKAIAV